jgi:hypothetical protein
MVDQLG